MSIWKTLSILVSIWYVVAAQPRSGKLEFEVVSIKPGDPQATSRSARTLENSWQGKNLRLFELIMSAWGLDREQIVGGPSWMNTAPWEIEAKFPAGTTKTQRQEMIRNMLADRFALATHTETRSLPIYELMVAKGGIKLQPGDGKSSMSAGQRMIRYSSGTMAELASQLTSYLGRKVIDKTGVSGAFAINLSFSTVDPADPSNSAESLPSIFQALQDQAGLRLVSAKGPVEVLVIDRAEKATEN